MGQKGRETCEHCGIDEVLRFLHTGSGTARCVAPPHGTVCRRPRFHTGIFHTAPAPRRTVPCHAVLDPV